MLAALLPAQIFIAMLIFVRLGAAMMFLPAFSEPSVPVRVRLLLALLVTLAVAPILAGTFPPLPEQAILLIASEAFIGLFLGLIARTIMSALQTAGMFIANVSTFANALINDPASAEQGSILGALLTILGLLVVVTLDLHHLLLIGVIDSYTLFVPGTPLMMEDFAQSMAMLVSKSFVLGFQLAAPFVGLAVIFYLGLGLISRLMPAMQVFFIAVPLQITIALTIMFFALPVMMMWFAQAFEEALLPFFAR
jgi:flagellar biosynthetic protein FliR